MSGLGPSDAPASRPAPAMHSSRRRHLVLVGAGHAHLQLLESWRGAPPAGVGLTVVVDRPDSLYSGMVPGAVAGEYELEELRIPVRPLVEAAGGRLIRTALTGVDPVGRRLFLADGTRVDYTMASLNLGAVDAGQDTPGVPERVVSARDAEALVRRGATMAGRAAVVVGGGAAGVELAAVLAAGEPAAAPVTLLEAGPGILGHRAERVARAAHGALEARGVRVRTGCVVSEVREEAVVLDSGETLEARMVVWAVGAAAPPLLADTPLPTDDDGYVRARATLQVEAHPDLFAVGSCASVADYGLPRAGVYAVRQGPVLRRNLEARLAGEPLERYRPDRDFLTLLNLGDGEALGAKWGRTAQGRWVRWLKDRIDRRWVARFRV